jgi:hypothetical protein
MRKYTTICEYKSENAQHAATADPRFATKTAQGTESSSFAPRGQALAKAQQANAECCFENSGYNIVNQSEAAKQPPTREFFASEDHRRSSLRGTG